MRDGAPASVREWTRRAKEAFTQLAPHERRQFAQRYQAEDERGWSFIEVERAPVIQRVTARAMAQGVARPVPWHAAH